MAGGDGSWALYLGHVTLLPYWSLGVWGSALGKSGRDLLDPHSLDMFKIRNPV